jgi:hypothetical protein
MRGARGGRAPKLAGLQHLVLLEGDGVGDLGVRLNQGLQRVLVRRRVSGVDKALDDARACAAAVEELLDEVVVF